MSPMNPLIVDDEPAARIALLSLCERGLQYPVESSQREHAQGRCRGHRAHSGAFGLHASDPQESRTGLDGFGRQSESAFRCGCSCMINALLPDLFRAVPGTGAGSPSFNLDNIPTGWYVGRVSAQPVKPSASGGARSKLLDAAIAVIREKGYAATSVDELCARAGVTKGAFFHHFPSKDSLAVTAANYWSELSVALFAAAPYQQLADPLDRVLGYLDFRKALLCDEVAEFTCLAGTMLQEAYETHPDIRDACDACIGGHAAKVESDIAEAMKLYRLRASWTAKSLALHTQAVLQGAFILAKAKGNAEPVEASIEHLYRYIELLFRGPRKKARRKN
jgi:TetR/AcrR family transcriptional repressor of nem operon